MTEPIRILHVVTYMGRGGLETMLMNYYRHIDRTKVQFDFLVHRDFEADYDEEIKQLGGKIYKLSHLNPLSKQYLNSLDKFFKNHPEYQIVHSHLDCMSAIPLKYAKKNGVPFRIAHAHSSSQTKDKKYFLKLIFKRFIPKYATNLFACGDQAGKWMFNGRPFKVLNNAIDSKKYVFNSEISKKVRYSLGISDDDFVIGHVGRFAPPKNHEFIVDLFNEVLKIRPNSKLLLVGDGELRQSIKEKVISLNVEDKVIFTGVRNDVPNLLQAMDLFLFPSIYEGLGIVAVEAQASGLTVIKSTTVPDECNLTNRVFSMSLNAPIFEWRDLLLEKSCLVRKNTTEEIIRNGYEVNLNAKWLQNFYLELQKKGED